MEDYFTAEAFAGRMAARKGGPRLPHPLAFFYHAALMPGWESVVAEQFAVMAAAGVDRVFVGVLGTYQAVVKFEKIAHHYGVGVPFLAHFGPDFSKHEEPTLTALHHWSKSHPSGAVVYLHTKGVSRPTDSHKRQWRRVMMRHVVYEWTRVVEHLQVADLVGCGWQTDPHYPHFCGNFWGARCDWLARLPAPRAYRDSRPDFSWAGWFSWKDRMFCETWPGAQPWHHVHDLVGMDTPLWAHAAWGLPAAVPGVDYDNLYTGE